MGISHMRVLKTVPTSFSTSYAPEISSTACARKKPLFARAGDAPGPGTLSILPARQPAAKATEPPPKRKQSAGAVSKRAHFIIVGCRLTYSITRSIRLGKPVTCSTPTVSSSFLLLCSALARTCFPFRSRQIRHDAQTHLLDSCLHLYTIINNAKSRRRERRSDAQCGTVQRTIHPSLIEKHGEHDIVAETRHAMQCWHLDDESEQIIDECVQRLHRTKPTSWHGWWGHKRAVRVFRLEMSKPCT